MSGGWWLPVLSASLLGSFHCIGMCGPLVAVAGDGCSKPRQRLSVQLTYQAGRLASYVALGAAAGTLGRAVDLAGRAAGWGEVAALVAGAAMALWGVSAMLDAAGVRGRWLNIRLLPAGFTRFLGSVHRRPPLVRAALLGGSSALLPCGFLYAFALAAAATGEAFAGATLMAAVWLGNLPALLGFGLAIGGALGRVKRHLPMLSAATVFFLGVYTLNQRLNFPAFALASVTAPSAPAPPDALSGARHACPCHRKPAP